MDGTSLVIRDIAEEDAGKYTVLVRIQQHALYQNLTLTLLVNGEVREIHWNMRANFVLAPIKPFFFSLSLSFDVCFLLHSESSDW